MCVGEQEISDESLSNPSSIDDSLKGLPPQVIRLVRRGLTLVSKIPEQDLSKIIEEVISHMAGGHIIDTEIIGDRFKLSKGDARDLSIAISTIIGMLSENSPTADEVMRAAVNANILDAGQTEAVRPFLGLILGRKTTIDDAMDRGNLSGGVLPSLTRFEGTIDARIGFEKNKPKIAVPVAVIHFDTDAENQEIWFQIGKIQLDGLIKNLQELATQLDAAEALLVEALRQR